MFGHLRSWLRPGLWGRAMASEAPRPSKRIRLTDEPCIVAMQRMLRGKEGIMSLAQGIVHWAPPPEALEAVRTAADEPDTNSYCADDGLPSLRAALKDRRRLARARPTRQHANRPHDRRGAGEAAQGEWA
eukprot:g33754.t1